MKTFKEFITEVLDQHALFADEIGPIIELMQTEKAYATIASILNRKLSEYPQAMQTAAVISAKSAAARWLREHKPEHWVLPLLEGKVQE